MNHREVVLLFVGVPQLPEMVHNGSEFQEFLRLASTLLGELSDNGTGSAATPHLGTTLGDPLHVSPQLGFDDEGRSKFTRHDR